jgi:tRNA pseudouridine38/39 synthase
MTSERDTIAQQIAQLQARLQQLDTNAPVASTSQLPSVPGTGKRGKKNGMLGPLPPALAAAPKRHIALLFSCVSLLSKLLFKKTS